MEIDLNKLIFQNIVFLHCQILKELMIKNNQLYLYQLFQDVPQLAICTGASRAKAKK